MKRLEPIFDKILLAVGILLIGVLWVQFPEHPTREVEHLTIYPSSETQVTSSAKWTHIRPTKELSPQQVIRIQLKALQQNDPADSGVITIFNFSSPTSKVNMGPINHFRLLVRDPAYRPMLNFKSYKAGQMVISKDIAYQLVVLEDTEGHEAAYMFILAKQKNGPYKDCWMTEGVTRFDNERETNII
ncbi:DUF4864 domain-containing protein [Pontibacter harenae]|uniref:DUF4864 domain-containing protein n=1 Tax=Pontibacter harenae TaxID=2894083 RepID=UPI001E526B71|nr:DUF4864 domain-containing protein [Pontibacter harenae]MCC9168034.1 DUF4864 domain-containing protein [Pontibacter harenae]